MCGSSSTTSTRPLVSGMVRSRGCWSVCWWSVFRSWVCRRSACRVRGRCPPGPVDANRAPRADRARLGLLTIPQHCADVRLRYGGQGGPDPSPASVKDPTG
ncbi:hypothetical protein GCM10010440_54710 [Kitasatospora cinereorecta]